MLQALVNHRGPARATATIRIAITEAAFEAICDTLPFGSVGYEAELNAKGERLIWMEDALMWRLASMRGPDESLSDVILRLTGRRRREE